MAADMQNRDSRRPQGRQIGYARVSTDEQATEAQEIELPRPWTIPSEHSARSVALKGDDATGVLRGVGLGRFQQRQQLLQPRPSAQVHGRIDLKLSVPASARVPLFYPRATGGPVPHTRTTAFPPRDQ